MTIKPAHIVFNVLITCVLGKAFCKTSPEEDGIVKRTLYPEVPPRVEYELTKFGKTMIPMLEAIALWGRELSAKEGQLMKKEEALALLKG